MTGLATPAIIGLESALGLWFLARPLGLLDLGVYVASMAASPQSPSLPPSPSNRWRKAASGATAR